MKKLLLALSLISASAIQADAQTVITVDYDQDYKLIPGGSGLQFSGIGSTIIDKVEFTLDDSLLDEISKFYTIGLSSVVYDGYLGATLYDNLGNTTDVISFAGITFNVANETLTIGIADAETTPIHLIDLRTDLQLSGSHGMLNPDGTGDFSNYNLMTDLVSAKSYVFNNGTKVSSTEVAANVTVGNVPEPSSVALLGLGSLTLCVRRKR